MLVLALDTAMFGCSVAVRDTETGKGAYRQEKMPRGQAEHLVPMVQDVMDEAGVTFQDLDLIATTIGPGAFTGLRIGMATAKGFALALDRPLVGLTTLEVLAAAYFNAHKLDAEQLLAVLIETKRQDYYCQFFKPDGTAFTDPQALSADEIIETQGGHDVVHIGDALERFATLETHVEDGFELPDPVLMATMAATRFDPDNPGEVNPLYLRGADVSAPKRTQRRISGQD